jgi:hypothetical protein
MVGDDQRLVTGSFWMKYPGKVRESRCHSVQAIQHLAPFGNYNGRRLATEDKVLTF